MNGLLTGGAGYIGSHTAVALVRVHQAVLYRNLSSRSLNVARQIEMCASSWGYPLAQGEQTEREQR